MEWYVKVLKDYAVFSGRARRKEYWMFYLFNSIAAFVLGILAGILANVTGIEALVGLAYVYSLAVLIPSLAVTIRRLHDVGKSGFWIFISFIPVIGGIWLLILLCKEGDPNTNDYGDSPK